MTGHWDFREVAAGLLGDPTGWDSRPRDVAEDLGLGYWGLGLADWTDYRPAAAACSTARLAANWDYSPAVWRHHADWTDFAC